MDLRFFLDNCNNKIKTASVQNYYQHTKNQLSFVRRLFRCPGFSQKISQFLPVSGLRNLFGNLSLASENINFPVSEPWLRFLHRLSSPPSSCIFYESSKSFAFVNLKPVLPGHVLVSPIRVVPLFEDLTLDEVSDLFQVAQKVEKVVKNAFHGQGD